MGEDGLSSADCRNEGKLFDLTIMGGITVLRLGRLMPRGVISSGAAAVWASRAFTSIVRSRWSMSVLLISVSPITERESYELSKRLISFFSCTALCLAHRRIA